MEKLQNEYLTVEVSDLGAELQSIKDADDKEYLWQGDDKYWGRRSPILFPIVCGLWKGTYRTEGETYQLGRHGFQGSAPNRPQRHICTARDREHATPVSLSLHAFSHLQVG